MPLGVIGIIYESRPNVTADAGALCLRRQCRDPARRLAKRPTPTRAIHAALRRSGLAAAGLPADAVQLVPDHRPRRGRRDAARPSGLIDIIVPRGGKGLVARVQAEARVPVLAHLEGICHIYVHAAADPAKAARIALNAKMRRTGVCGATETLLIDRALSPPMLAPIVEALADAGCEIRGDASSAGARSARHCRRHRRGLGHRISRRDRRRSRVVDGVDGAIAPYRGHGSHHTDAIVTEDAAAAERFLAEVDSAIVMWNASTQFADGGEFGFGAEIGIATGRLHARGPVALERLTTYKMAGARQRPGQALKRVGLLGGSFNPAHRGPPRDQPRRDASCWRSTRSGGWSRPAIR